MGGRISKLHVELLFFNQGLVFSLNFYLFGFNCSRLNYKPVLMFDEI